MITKFRLTHLNCGACVKVSQMKISKIPGVTDVRFTQDENTKEAAGTLEADRSIATEEIQKALEGTEYKVEEVTSMQ